MWVVFCTKSSVARTFGEREGRRIPPTFLGESKKRIPNAYIRLRLAIIPTSERELANTHSTKRPSHQLCGRRCRIDAHSLSPRHTFLADDSNSDSRARWPQSGVLYSPPQQAQAHTSIIIISPIPIPSVLCSILASTNLPPFARNSNPTCARAGIFRSSKVELDYLTSCLARPS